MSKEIWKLIELLNEYHFFNTDCINYVLDEEENRIYLKEEFDWFYHEQRINAERIISKKFWFIKWLVENEKINFKKFDGDNCDYLENPIWSNNYDECDYLDLIQWLAISDTPIDDLIYYLK